MSEALLKVENLKVRYGAVEAVRSVSLDVYQGEVVTLLGANGAGKSSLLRAVMGIIPYEGAISFEGKSFRGLKTQQIVQRHIALVPEGRGILATLTVRENLEMGGFYQADWESSLERMFQLFPILKERLEQSAGTLSGGEQQMLAVARALLSKPKLLLLDEPSLGLAPMMIQQIFKLITQIKSEGMTILLIEQNAHMALKISDRAYLMETGHIRSQGRSQDMMKNDELSRAYLGG